MVLCRQRHEHAVDTQPFRHGLHTHALLNHVTFPSLAEITEISLVEDCRSGMMNRGQEGNKTKYHANARKKKKKINAFEYEKFKLVYLIIELIKCIGKCILKC